MFKGASVSCENPSMVPKSLPNPQHVHQDQVALRNPWSLSYTQQRSSIFTRSSHPLVLRAAKGSCQTQLWA